MEEDIDSLEMKIKRQEEQLKSNKEINQEIDKNTTRIRGDIKQKNQELEKVSGFFSCKSCFYFGKSFWLHYLFKQKEAEHFHIDPSPRLYQTKGQFWSSLYMDPYLFLFMYSCCH